MQTTKPIDFQCPACGYQTKSTVTTIVDPAFNPQDKTRLLSGSLNVIQCANCGTPSTASTPLLYHDASKELLITFVPMALNMSSQESDRFIGVLMNEVTRNMDQKLVKGYIFQPKRALTMQGLIEQILEADGVTKEMQEEQRERARLVQTFLQSDPDTFEALVREHDDRIDEQFFTTLSVAAQQTAQQGRPDMAEYILGVQQRIAELSTAGKDLLQRAEAQQTMVEEVAMDLQELGTQPTPADVIAIVEAYAGDDERLQATVGLARPLFDYAFFEALAERIRNASDSSNRTQLEQMRDVILQLTQVIDQQTEMEMQEAANLLRELLNHPDPEDAIRTHLGQIDETLMGVLELNIQQAEKQGDIAASAKLKSLRDQIMKTLQANMRPDVRFINDLLSAESESAARQLIDEQAKQYGAELLETFDALLEVVQAQGQQQVAERLRLLRAAAAEALES